MSSEHRDPRVLTRYLLGALPDTETEKLDELAITDDELAWRLAEAENELVDAYVRGELSGEDLDRFRRHYLSSAKRREKVMFAGALRDHVEKGHVDTPARALPVAARPARRAPGRALAAAAVVLLAAAGYLLFANGRLRQELSAAQSQRAALQARADGLQKELEEQRVAAAEARKPPPSGGLAQAMLERLQIVSVVLSPQRRGVEQVATLSIPSETDVVALQLQLESDEFPQYEVAVKSAADNRVAWRSGKLKSVASNGRKIVTASVPAALLSPGHFTVELAGLASEGRPHSLASYAFRTVAK